MIALLLCLSREPDAPGKGFEMSVVEQTVCRPFCYPTPYQLHYSQSYQKQFTEDLDGWCRRMNGVDYDRQHTSLSSVRQASACAENRLQRCLGRCRGKTIWAASVGTCRMRSCRYWTSRST